MNLKSKITLNICIIVLLSLIVMCSSIYAMSASILSAESNKFTEVQILRAQEKIDLLVEKTRLETLALSREQKIRDFFQGTLSTDTLNEYLTNTMSYMNQDSGSNYYKDLFCVDLDGIITASTMPNAMYVDLSSRKYIQDSLKKYTTETSNILNALTDRTNIVNTTHPVFDENGKLLGLLGIAIKAENFVGFIKDYNIGEHGYFSIIDSSGFILSHRKPELIGKPAVNVLPAFKDMNFDSSGTIHKYYDWDFVYSYKKMDKNDWLLYTAMPKRELTAKSMSLLKYVVFYGIIISGCAIFVSIYYSNKISSPIVSITNYINSAKNRNELLDSAIEETIENVKSPLHTNANGPESDQNADAFIKELKERMETKNATAFDKEAFALIKKSKTLTDALEMKSYLTAKFLSSLSHDIRTSLTLIKGYAKGLMSGLIEDEETKERFIKEIFHSANTLEQISYDVLDSTYEAQYSNKQKKEDVAAREFCESLYQTAQAYIENSDRLFEGSLDIIEGSFYISKVKILRVWQNMLSNAVKYSAPYSTVTIRIAYENGLFRFQVLDQGIGIKENDREYIFDMFYKGDLSQKESYGLGLFVSKRILEAHNSRMCFTSTPGMGSTFWFTLDAKKETEEE